LSPLTVSSCHSRSGVTAKPGAATSPGAHTANSLLFVRIHSVHSVFRPNEEGINMQLAQQEGFGSCSNQFPGVILLIILWESNQQKCQIRTPVILHVTTNSFCHLCDLHLQSLVQNQQSTIIEGFFFFFTLGEHPYSLYGWRPLQIRQHTGECVTLAHQPGESQVDTWQVIKSQLCPLVDGSALGQMETVTVEV